MDQRSPYFGESETLRRSAWPKCDVLAAELASRGAPALDALEAAMKSRTHHVRSAVLRAMAAVDPLRARRLAELALQDRAYEVRETAAMVLGVEKPK